VTVLRELFDRAYPRVVERLARLGVPRAWPPLLVIGVLAATTSVVLATVLWITGRTGPTHPPAAADPALTGKDGTSVVKSDRAQVRSITMVTRNRWAAGWSDCMSGSTCRYSAVIDRDGVKATAPEWPVPYATLRAGTEAVAVAPPREGTLTGDPTMLFRLTYDGPVLTRLRYVLPTETFQSDEILTDQIVPGRIVVVNAKDATVRMLQTPGARSPACDTSGRCWILTGVGRTDISWTDDGGKNWDSVPLDAHNQLGKLAVSPNGQTLVMTAVSVDAAMNENIARMRISTDRGAHWASVQDTPVRLDAAPLAFDNGTAVLLGGRAGDPKARLYRISDGVAGPDTGYPGDLADLAGDADLLYGFEVPRRRTTEATYSTNQGKTWTKFAPR
jgi:hypothetical protein